MKMNFVNVCKLFCKKYTIRKKLSPKLKIPRNVSSVISESYAGDKKQTVCLHETDGLSLNNIYFFNGSEKLNIEPSPFLEVNHNLPPFFTTKS